MDGRRLSTQHSPNIVASPTCPCLLLYLLTPFSKLPLTTRQWNPPMLSRDWKLRPTMPLTKENPVLPLPRPPMALTNPCLLGCIWETIVPMWSMRLGLKSLHNQRKIQENQEVTAATKEVLHHRLENMASDFYVIYCWWQLTSEVLDNTFSLDIWVIYFLKIISNINEIVVKCECDDRGHKEGCFCLIN